jgi:hypothetical protein
MRQIIVILDIEAKDEYEGGAGREPADDADRAVVVAGAQDTLADVTKHNWELPWMVRGVRLMIP